MLHILLNSWQFFLIVNIIGDVIFTQGFKLAVRNAKDDTAATILLEFIAGITILLFIPFFPWRVPTNPVIYLFLLLSTIFGAVNDRLKTTARKFLPASEASLLNQLPNVFTIIIGFIFFKEAVLWQKIVGAILIFSANIWLSYREGKFVVNKYTLYFVSACLALSIAISLDIGFSQYFNLALYIALVYFLSATFVSLGSRPKLSAIAKEFTSSNQKYYLLTGMVWPIAFLGIVRASQLGSISVVMPIATISILLNVLVATVVHQERNHFKKYLIAGLIIMAGITITSLVAK